MKLKPLNRVRNGFGHLRDLGTVPGIMAVGMWFLCIPVLAVDAYFPDFFGDVRLLYVDYDTGRALVSTVASASITTLGLVYSLVLLVFTTAAGNIGPRLLQRFTGDRANQITAGLLGGTYLFSLSVLHQTDESFVPHLSIAFVIVFAALCVLQLIFFVHQASISVTVDEEVAEVAKRLQDRLSELIRQEEEGPSPEFDSSHMCWELKARKSGYVSAIDPQALIEFAADNDLRIELKARQGDFVLAGLPILSTSRELAESEAKALGEIERDAVRLSRSRNPAGDIEFSINLLVEIAVRALSPGLNDTFTAIACVDRLSSALALPVEYGLQSGTWTDDMETPRLKIPGFTLESLLDRAYDPLRQTARSNVLMTISVLKSLGRLSKLANDESLPLVRWHLDKVIDGSRSADLQAVDLEKLETTYRKIIRATRL